MGRRTTGIYRIKTKISMSGRTLNVSLVRGPVARVYYSKKGPMGAEKPLRLWEFSAGKERSSWHPLDELERLNNRALEENEHVSKHGKDYAVPDFDEVNALNRYRNFRAAEKSAAKNRAAKMGKVIDEKDIYVVPLSVLVDAAIKLEESRGATDTISETVEKYIEEKRRLKITEQRIAVLRSIFKIFIKGLNDKRLGEVTISDVDEIIDKLEAEGKATTTVKSCYLAICSLFQWGYDKVNFGRNTYSKLKNPLEGYKKPFRDTKHAPDIISPEELKNYLEYVRRNSPGLLMCEVVQAFSGCRRSEALRLRWRDFHRISECDGGFELGNKKYSYVHLSLDITKTKISRSVPIFPCEERWLDLADSQNPDDFIVFPQIKGDKRESKIAGMLGYFRKKKIVDASMMLKKNVLRHTAASCLYALFGRTRAADICGHSVRIASVHYQALVLDKDARAWFNVFPSDEL